MQNSAERAAFDLFAQPRHFGMKAPVVAEAERDAGLAHGCDRAFGFLFGQRERLFAEHVFFAAAAAITWAACMECGVASTTASIAGSARIAS